MEEMLLVCSRERFALVGSLALLARGLAAFGGS
jgi:hypothetical protein